ncbi:hypothetical protein [Streptomyces mutabilis]|uniref:hypothetical protein n=1 Tax=Streptomyces mutabilis TaxID=67332 RepID=UPI0036953DFB
MWDALLAQRRRAGIRRTFQDLCEASPQGVRTYPVTRVALVESDSVRNGRKFRQQRMLPVPLKVDTSGKVFMEARIKIHNKGESRLASTSTTTQAMRGRIYHTRTN